MFDQPHSHGLGEGTRLIMLDYLSYEDRELMTGWAPLISKSMDSTYFLFLST